MHHRRALPAFGPATRFTLAIVLWALLGATRAEEPAAPAEPTPSLTSTARLLAGLPPAPDDAGAGLVVTRPAWIQHAKAARAGDRQLRARLSTIRRWANAHLPALAPHAALVYPFSGPDFVNAYALYPDADEYVFFSLEPVGSVPALASMDDEALGALFADLRAALNDLVALNFFITPNMKESLHTDALQGTVPILLAMMGVLELQVDEVAADDPWPARTREYTSTGARHRPALVASGVRIAFTDPRTGHHQSLRYLSIDVSDYELRSYPEFLPWLESHPRPTVLLKSASYLLHGTHFRQLRRSLLDHAEVIVQDDTGMPLRLLQDAGFTVSLFGQYERPVKLFEERYQPDLEAAFEKSGDARPLPFPFGYNWRKEGKSGLILAQKTPASGH